MDVTHKSFFIPDSQAVFFHCPYNLSTTLDFQIEAQLSLILKYDEWTKFQNNFTQASLDAYTYIDGEIKGAKYLQQGCLFQFKSITP